MRAYGRIAIAAACLALLAGCDVPDPGSGTPPHGDAAPPPTSMMLTNADIEAWLSAISGYHAQSNPCYLITQAQGAADLAHSGDQWKLDGGAARPGSPTGAECLIDGPLQQPICLCPAHGETVGLIRIQQGWQRPTQPPTTYRQAPIPGTSWSLVYMAWYERLPTDNEMAWVMRDLAINLSQPPPPTAPKDRFPR